MIRKRTIGTLAALGGLTAAIALLSGLPSAKADELADLRANQELLQRRVDQLAQIPAVGSPVGGLYGGGPRGPVGVAMAGGSFPRSFLVPGTDTSLRVGGEISEVFDYWFNGGNPNTTPQNSTVGDTGQLESIPLHVHTAAGNPARSRGNSIFWQTPRQSKLNIETRTPTAWGEARTFMEFDWAGSNAFVPGGSNPVQIADNLAPRVRFIYGTLGGWLAGQANSNFADPDANGEAIDFGGNAGEPGVVRIPQIRYTMPLASWGIPGALSASAETPSTEAVTAAGAVSSDMGAGTITANPALACPVVGATATCAIPGNLPATNPTKAAAPDLTAAWYIPQPWGHVDYGVVVRPDLQFKDGLYVDRSFVGYGVHFGGDVKPGWFGWPKDDIIFHFTYGDGIGRYLNSGGTTNFALISNYPSTAAPATAAAAANVRIRTTVEWGGEVGYQHWWLPNLRSNVSIGINHHDIPILGGALGFVCSGAAKFTGGGNCGLNKELVSARLNLIWNPVPFVDVDLEYVYGHRQVLSNIKGDENTLVSKVAVKF